MSDTYGTNGQSPVETQETAEAVKVQDEVLPTEDEKAVEQPVENTKVKKKRKAKAPAAKKPTKKAKAAIELDDFGFRKKSIRSKAALLYSRSEGATLDEVKRKCGSVQYNMLTELKKRGFKVTTKEIDGKGNRPATRFFLKSKKR